MRSVPIIFQTLCLAACTAYFALATSADELPPIYAWDNIDRVYAVGDIHGAYAEVVELLEGNGLIDASHAWQGGNAHVVSLGDMLDRGSDSRKVMELFMALQGQAAAAGGAFHVVLGNHELMNLSGDLRDVSEAEFESHGGRAAHQSAFAANGRYGRWLRTLPGIVRINNTLFVHGGISAVLADQSLDEINTQLKKQLTALLEEGAKARAKEEIGAQTNLLDLPEAVTTSPVLSALRAEPLFGPAGPLWYRGNARCHIHLEAPNIEARLRQFGVKRIVIAHTPTPTREITSRFNGAVVMSDTGMLKTVYKGNQRLLKLSRENIEALDAEGRAHPIVELSFAADSAATTEFVPLGKTARRRALATYRLDRVLGINMVPLTKEQQINGRSGILISQPPAVISEAQRVDGGHYRPNPCHESSDYQLLAAFDALTGMRQRNADNLLYSRPDWSIVLNDTHQTFGSSTNLPTYATPPRLPAGFATVIEQLTEEELTKEFDGLLKKNEIRALLKRRDAILTWPRSGISNATESRDRES